MPWRSHSRQSWITSLLNYSSVIANHHRLHMSHLYKKQQQPHLQLRLPNQVGRAQRVPIETGQNSGAAVPTVDASLAPATATAGAEEDDDYADDYADEVDQNQNYMQPPAPGRPQAYNGNGRAALPAQV